MKLQDKFDYVVSELKEYLCVTQLIDDGGAPKIRVSAHVTGGRLHPRGEKIEYAQKKGRRDLILSS